jgi:hypothetical protein
MASGLRGDVEENTKTMDKELTRADGKAGVASEVSPEGFIGHRAVSGEIGVLVVENIV